jgi:hypothetical protein
MDGFPELGTAMDIMTEEVTAPSQEGYIVNVNSLFLINNNIIMTTTEFFTKLIKQLPVDIQNGPWIVGGFPLSVYRNDNIFTHDIDYFFKDYDQYMEYVNKFKTKIAEVKPDPKRR